MKQRRIKFVKQLDAMQCGVASLSMVCSYYGKSFSVSYLNGLCSATSEGISLAGLKYVAENIGFDVIIGKGTVSLLDRNDLPCIIHWGQNHFVVLYKVSKKGDFFYVADPAKGKVKYNREDFEKHWASDSDEGIIMFLDPTDTFFQLNEQKIGKRDSYYFLIRYISRYKHYFLLIALGLITASILQLITPFLTKSIVDIGITNKDIGFVGLILLGELLIIIGKTSIDFIRRWILLHISMRINISLLSDFFIKLLQLPMCFFDTKHLGDLIQRMSDHNRVQSFLTTQILNILFSILNLVVLGFVIFLFDRVIFSIFILCSFIYSVWIILFLNHRRNIDYEIFELQAKNQNKTFQFLSTMQEIKLQDCEKRRRWEWEDIQADLFVVQMKSLKLQQTQEAGRIVINEIKNILITAFSATAVINGDISLGTMLAIQFIVGQLNSPIDQLMFFINAVQDVKISLERIDDIHKGRNEETETNSLYGFASTKSIRLYNVNFKYELYSQNKTLDNVSFNIPEGKVTAIVGTSGSGKSTLIKLMLGFYPVMSGVISVAGRNINEYNLKWWRQHCGVVMQDGVIFSESIARNIAVDDSDIDVVRLEKAAQLANIHDYITGLPLKYNTQIGRDGVGLSQGQKQRILIARAVYKNPDFIFLDEATNALDTKNERVIVENLNEFYKGRTVVVVAHRLSTVKNADQIIVLDGGRVVETGDHTSLISNKGAYYNLVKNQLELGN